MDCVRGDPILN